MKSTRHLGVAFFTLLFMTIAMAWLSLPVTPILHNPASAAPPSTWSGDGGTVRINEDFFKKTPEAPVPAKPAAGLSNQAPSNTAYDPSQKGPPTPPKANGDCCANCTCPHCPCRKVIMTPDGKMKLEVQGDTLMWVPCDKYGKTIGKWVQTGPSKMEYVIEPQAPQGGSYQIQCDKDQWGNVVQCRKVWVPSTTPHSPDPNTPWQPQDYATQAGYGYATDGCASGNCGASGASGGGFSGGPVRRVLTAPFRWVRRCRGC